MEWYKEIYAKTFKSALINKKRNIMVSDIEDNSQSNESSTSSIKKPKIINIERETEKSKWDKLPSFIRKIILFASSSAIEVLSLSDKYLELLQCNSNKTSLLLLTSIAAREQNAFSIQLNLMSNIIKGLLIGQSILFPEGLNPFETLSAPVN